MPQLLRGRGPQRPSADGGHAGGGPTAYFEDADFAERRFAYLLVFIALFELFDGHYLPAFLVPALEDHAVGAAPQQVSSRTTGAPAGLVPGSPFTYRPQVFVELHARLNRGWRSEGQGRCPGRVAWHLLDGPYRANGRFWEAARLDGVHVQHDVVAGGADGLLAPQ